MRPCASGNVVLPETAGYVWGAGWKNATAERGVRNIFPSFTKIPTSEAYSG